MQGIRGRAVEPRCPLFVKGGTIVGMFDSLKCEYPLPDVEMQGHTFQTKDLECELGHYIISKEGRLLQERRIFKKNGKKTYLPFLEMWQDDVELIETKLHDEEYHGDIHFYDFNVEPHYNWELKKYDDNGSHMITYVARFTNGTLESIGRDDGQAS